MPVSAGGADLEVVRENKAPLDALDERRLRDLARQLPDVAADLACLRQLLRVDVLRGLKQMRYSSEKVLRTLCAAREMSWDATGETPERIIDELAVDGVLPGGQVLQLRTIYASADPGIQHPTARPTIVPSTAIAAFCDFLTWYAGAVGGNDLQAAALSAAIDVVKNAELRLAFRILAAVELHQWPQWEGPEAVSDLRELVQFLASARGLVDAAHPGSLPRGIAAWCAHFSSGEPPTIEALRSLTRLVANIDPETEDDVALLQRALLALGLESSEEHHQEEAGRHQERARLLCAQALSVWHQQLRRDERWTALPSAVPGEKPTPINEVYVDLYAVQAWELPEYEAPAVEQARRLARRSIRQCSRPSVFRLCSPGRSAGPSSLASRAPGNLPSCNGLPGPLLAVP